MAENSTEIDAIQGQAYGLIVAFDRLLFYYEGEYAMGMYSR